MGLAEELPVYKKSYDLSINKLPFNYRVFYRNSTHQIKFVAGLWQDYIK